MTRIHFLYFPVEELSENGATIAVQRNSREKNVKAWWWVGGLGCQPPYSPILIRCKKEFSKVNKKTNHPISLMVKRFEHFTKEDIQVA